jgi:hypothetical protein
MKHLVISVGPIPAKLDSVKLITNKFKGGLALQTAKELAKDFVVTIVAHQSTNVSIKDWKDADNVKIIRIGDVMHYHEVIKATDADVYVLAGAVANLMPVNPWKGKFPSHQYKEGEVFDIPFTLAPRIIDRVRTWHPKATLIGYKLFDGTQDELVAAGHETLRHSKATVVFCNHPSTAKDWKTAVTSDGSVIGMNFAEHIAWIRRCANLEWFSTKHKGEAEGQNKPHAKLMEGMLEKVTVESGPYLFGTVAIRDKEGPGFWTTARGKTGNRQFVHVADVDLENRTVTVDGPVKATLNAPTLHAIFTANPAANVIIHGHNDDNGEKFPTAQRFPYAFPGTTEEVTLAQKAKKGVFQVEHHGYYTPVQLDLVGLD